MYRRGRSTAGTENCDQPYHQERTVDGVNSASRHNFTSFFSF
jgi:hypothetical protein